jgi:hypothetical protein
MQLWDSEIPFALMISPCLHVEFVSVRNFTLLHNAMSYESLFRCPILVFYVDAPSGLFLIRSNLTISCYLESAILLNVIRS